MLREPSLILSEGLVKLKNNKFCSQVDALEKLEKVKRENEKLRQELLAAQEFLRAQAQATATASAQQAANSAAVSDGGDTVAEAREYWSPLMTHMGTGRRNVHISICRIPSSITHGNTYTFPLACSFFLS